MPELLTMQDLANGHLDVKALGEAANGDENTIVTTRTGNTYPSAERAINIMFGLGGLPAEPFATLAKMQTDGASLADGQLAMVYNETANNGLYVKKLGAWIKSKYGSQDLILALEQSVGVLSGRNTLTPKKAYVRVTGGDTVYSTTVQTISSLVVDVNAGDEYELVSANENQAKAYYITNETGVVLSEAPNGVLFDGVITIPTGGAKLYVNVPDSVQATFRFKLIPDIRKTSALNDIQSRLGLLLGSQKLATGVMYIKDTATNKVQTSGLSGISSTSIIVRRGDSFIVTAQGLNQAKRYFITDSTGTVIAESVGNAVVTEQLVMPDNAAMLYINNSDTNTDFKLQYIPDISSLLKGSGFNSWFTDGAPVVTQTITMSGRSMEVSYTGNPRFIDSAGNAAYLFPKTGSDYKLPLLPPYGVMYTKAMIPSSYSNAKYLEPSEILIGSFINSLTDFKGATILAVNNDSSIPMSYGIVGNKYNADLIKKVPQLVTDVTAVNTRLDDLSASTGVKASFPDAPSYFDLLATKCPKFYKNFKDKSKDVAVVITGTSMTQGNLYSSERVDATTRPPLLHTKDLASLTWDKLSIHWDGQKYRRYDHPDLVYSEGNWTITNDLKISELSIWDDKGASKNGMTKTTALPDASVSIQIPSDAYQFNFIYRTDSKGAACTVSIAEGAGEVEVYNGTTWVEANGYALTMLEPEVTPTKGNTIYQKRLKMRCKNRYVIGGINSIGTTKTLTITKDATTGNFNVVGFEWSPREFMLTFINAARGAHQWGNGYNLENYQDGDVWQFNPDLILMEVTAINWGAGYLMDVAASHFVNIAKRGYFNEFNDHPKGIYEQSEQYTRSEIVFYGSAVPAASAHAANYNPVTGDMLYATVTTPVKNGVAGSSDDSVLGIVKNGFDSMYAVDEYMSTKDAYIFIPVTAAIKKVADKHYGGYWFAMRPSGKDGATLSIDGTHYNDNGAAMWAHFITPLFDNL